MLTPATLLGLVTVGALIWLIVHLVTQSSTAQPLARRERAELDSLRSLVDDLKETAWDHRELDSPLATIIIDKIRTHERRGRELGP
jgi:hypothetical protein